MILLLRKLLFPYYCSGRIQLVVPDFMKQLTINFNFLLAIGLLTILGSCGVSGRKDAAATQLDTSDALARKTELLNTIDSLLGIMPKPSAVPNIIARTGIEYNSSLLCDPKSVDKTAGNSSATAFCLGVFGADIAYMVASERGREAVTRFAFGKKMADRIGISGAIDVHLMESIENNLSNRDSLILLTDSYIKKSSEILKAGEQTKDAAMISAGAVIEGLYITAGLIREYPATGLPKAEQDRILVPLYKTLFDQEASINNLITLLDKVNGDEESAKLQGMLKEMAAIYQEGQWNQKVAASQGKFFPGMFEIAKLDSSIVKVRSSMVP